MERILNITCRTAGKLLQLRLQFKFPNAPYLHNFKMYSSRFATNNATKLKILHKQLGFLRCRAIEDRNDIDAKIAKLQKRIELIREHLNEASVQRGNWKQRHLPRNIAKREGKEKKYCDKIHESGKAKENIHFLKLQRQQLEDLRRRVSKEKKLIKEKLDELEKKIKTASKKNKEDLEKSSKKQEKPE